MATVKVYDFLHSHYAITRTDGLQLSSHLTREYNFIDGELTSIVVDFTDMKVVASPFLNGLASIIGFFMTDRDKTIRPEFFRLYVEGIDPALWQRVVHGNYLYLTSDKYRDAVDAALAIEAGE